MSEITPMQELSLKSGGAWANLRWEYAHQELSDALIFVSEQ